MTRSIGSIVSSHLAAQSRRKAGLPVWDRTINIKGIIRKDQENVSLGHVAQVAKEIARSLRHGIPCKWLDMDSDDYDWEINQIINSFEYIFEHVQEDAALEELNYNLAELYDWADSRRVWLG